MSVGNAADAFLAQDDELLREAGGDRVEERLAGDERALPIAVGGHDQRRDGHRAHLEGVCRAK